MGRPQPLRNSLPDGTARQDTNTCSGTLTAYGEGVAVVDVAKGVVGALNCKSSTAKAVAREPSEGSFAPSMEDSNGSFFSSGEKDYGWQKVPDIISIYEEVGRPQPLRSNECIALRAAVPATPSAKSPWPPDGTPSPDTNSGTLPASGEGVAVAGMAKQFVGASNHTGHTVRKVMAAGAMRASSQPATGIGDEGDAPLYYEEEV